MQKNVPHRYIKVKKAIEGQDFINTWKIKDINVLTSIEILLNGKKFTMYIPSSKTRPRPYNIYDLHASGQTQKVKLISQILGKVKTYVFHIYFKIHE